MTPICSLTLPLNEPDWHEIRRYAGCPEGAEDEIRQCLAELAALNGKICYCECKLRESNGLLDMEFAKTGSQALQKALKGCERAVLFAATVGLLPDRLIAKYSRISPTKAFWIQAIGTERVEAACDAFCSRMEKEYAGQGCRLTARFSPGYGDLPLDLQKELFRVLDCPRQIGLTLNESLLMMPSKSVTAIAGIRPGRQESVL